MEHIFNIIPGPQEDACCILLYGEIGDSDWAEAKAQHIVEQLIAAERTYRKIDVRINSVGGEVNAGIAIFNVLHQSKADITIYIDCIAASTASFIAGCGKPVKMSRYARMMIHRPKSCVFGDTEDLKTCIAKLETIEDTLCQIYSERTGRSVDDIRTTYMDGADHWLSADEALALGFVDEIYDDPHAVSITDSLTTQQRCERYTACYLEAINVSLNTENQMTIEQFRAMPTFSDCADEAAIMARFTQIEAKAAAHDAVAAECDALKGQVEEFRTKERAAAEAAYDVEVDTARTEERIGADEVPSFKALMRKDPENTRALIAARKPKRRATTVIDQAGAAGKGDPWGDRFEEIRKGLKK